MSVFLEWLEYVMTPSAAHVRAMGYLRESICIKSRHRRCRSAWADHLERSRQTILAAVGCCPSHRRAVVFGSGMLLDIPLLELSQTFQEVVLVDIVHPLRTRRQKRKLPNVRLITEDITGTVLQVYQSAHDSTAPLPDKPVHLDFMTFDVDLVVSANILSQLPVLPTRYLESLGKHKREAIHTFAAGLVRRHIEYLAELSCPTALIADVERLVVDVDEKVIEHYDALRDVALPWSGEQWIWKLAPRPEAHRKYSYYRKVVGIPCLKNAPSPTR